MQPWGQGQRKKQPNRPLAPKEIEAMVLKAEREAMVRSHLDPPPSTNFCLVEGTSAAGAPPHPRGKRPAAGAVAPSHETAG